MEKVYHSREKITMQSGRKVWGRIAPPAALRKLQYCGESAGMASPFWGKLSPQVTDEGTTAKHFPLIRRVQRHLPPKGKAFPRHNGNCNPTTKGTMATHPNTAL